MARSIMTNLSHEVKHRLSMLISEGKLITVADISDDKDRIMANKILQKLQQADLLQQGYGEIVFDTTSSSTSNRFLCSS